jgi:hypothetical protein
MCARTGQVLGIPAEQIHIEEVASDRVPNSSPTAASLSTDLYGAAVMDACQTLAERLKPFLEASPKPTWQAGFLLSLVFISLWLSPFAHHHCCFISPLRAYGSLPTVA